MSHVSTFRAFLEKEFGILLPKEVALQEQERVIRVFSKTAMMMKPSGYMGFVAGRVGTKGIVAKSEFMQMFGKNANRNVVMLDMKQMRELVQKEFVQTDAKGGGQKIAKYGRHVLGVGMLREGRLYLDFIGKGRKRAENEIKP